MKQPNIIFYFSDQQRWDTLGCYGQKLPVTPNLDELAREGVKFANMFTCQPVCGPARACLQSGRYATQIGCWRNAQALPQGIPTLAGAFRGAGYETAYVGKWHLASNKSSYEESGGPEDFEIRAVPPERRGGYEYWMASDVLEFTSHGYDGYVFDGDGRRRDFVGYRADCINNYAIQFLHNRQRNRPFFLFLSQIEPHHQNDHHRFEGPDGSRRKFANYEVPGDLVGTEGDWRENYPDYLGQCHSLDENVGRLVDTLKDQGLWDNTILFYTSDHGSHFCTRNGEYKRACHDACTHVPLIAVGGPFQGGKTVHELVSLLDLPVTLLDCAGITPPEEFVGQSLLPLLKGDTSGRPEEVFMQISESEIGRAIRTPQYTYCVRAQGDAWNSPGATLYEEEYFYVLADDPHQRHNRVDDPAFAAARAACAQRLKARMKEAGEPEPVIVPKKG